MKTNSTSISKITLILTFFISFSTLSFAQTADVSQAYFSLDSKEVMFNAVPNNNKINLNWVIKAESNDDHFEVERSLDKTNFRTIGLVLDAQTANSTTKQYSFRDGLSQLADHNVIHYRLKQIDIDGKISYSGVKAVRLNPTITSKPFVQVFPNPYVESVNVNFTSEVAGDGQVRLINSAGQVTATKESPVNKGYNTLQIINLNTVATGVYYVETSVNGKVINNQKIVK